MRWMFCVVNGGVRRCRVQDWGEKRRGGGGGELEHKPLAPALLSLALNQLQKSDELTRRACTSSITSA